MIYNVFILLLIDFDNSILTRDSFFLFSALSRFSLSRKEDIIDMANMTARPRKGNLRAHYRSFMPSVYIPLYKATPMAGPPIIAKLDEVM